MMSGRTLRIAARLLLVCLAAAGAGCRGGDGEPGPAAPRVAIIGWDGASWTVIDPMLRSGRLPNLARLLENGSRGVLVAEPPMFSPALWTTMATGFRPEEHGVLRFQLPDPGDGDGLVLASTLHRRRAPLWRILSTHQRSVGFVGWWTTWPAEPVRGYVISDHLAYNRWDAWSRRVGGEHYHLTFPPELVEELAPLAVRPADVEPETITALVPFNEQERREMMEATRPVMFHAPSVLRFGYATDASNAAFAAHLLETREQPDLFSVVFVLSDVAGHVLWHHFEPESFPHAPEDAGRLAEGIPNVYEQLDRWTGEILDRLEPGTRVVLVSDHGMRAGGELPEAGVRPAGDHHTDGILVVSGEGLPRDAPLGRLRGLDLAPTILAMLGLPVAEDMPGRTLESIAPETAQRVASYGDGGLDVAPDLPSPGEEDYLERLRSLGYIQ